MRFRVPGKGTQLYELTETSGALSGMKGGEVGEPAWMGLEDVLRAIGEGDVWPASGMAGSGRMPVF
jgi:hypothetical protein